MNIELEENIIFDEYYREFSFIKDDLYYSVTIGSKIMNVTPCHSLGIPDIKIELDKPILSLSEFKKQLTKRGIINE